MNRLLRKLFYAALLSDVRTGSVQNMLAWILQADSLAFPAGRIGQPFYGWLRKALITARLNGLSRRFSKS